MLLTLAGSIVIPVGLVAPAVVMVQLLTSDPGGGVLEHLVRGGVVDDPQIDSVGHDVFGTRVGAVQAEAAGRILTAGEACRGAGVLVDLVALGIDDPDVGAVGGNALHRGLGGQRTSGPEPSSPPLVL